MAEYPVDYTLGTNKEFDYLGTQNPEPRDLGISDVLGLEENRTDYFEDRYGALPPITYNVYQTRSQNTGMSDQDIQNLYGTSAMPVFEWVKKIQSGQRTYNPQDAFENDLMEQYKRMNEAGQVPEGMMTPQEIMAQQALQGSAGQIGQTIGSNIGAGITNPYGTGSTLDKSFAGLMNTGTKTPIEQVRQVSMSNPYNTVPDTTKNYLDQTGLTDNFTEELFTRDLARATGNEDAFVEGLKTRTLKPIPKTNTFVPSDKFAETVNPLSGDEITGFPEGYDATRGVQTVSQSTINPTMGDAFNPFTDAGSSNLMSSGVGAGVNFVGRIAAGQDIDDAAKSAADAGFIQYATTALLTATPLAPFATIIGGVVGGFLGRVICNELMRQGIMDRKQVVLDYKFTRDYLTPTHVAGYHVWAVWMVKQMRKGRLVKLWSHIAGHRANEIAYIYGERDKPDYLGKLYRKILEPICWTVGTFCKETDWSILYKKKEI